MIDFMKKVVYDFDNFCTSFNDSFYNFFASEEFEIFICFLGVFLIYLMAGIAVLLVLFSLFSRLFKFLKLKLFTKV